MLAEATSLKTVDPVLPRPLVRELSADLETPTSVYLKLCGAGPSFLLESVEGGERVARYSFIGVRPARQYHLRPGLVERHGPGGITRLPLAPGADALHVLQAELAPYQSAHVEGLPRFIGGLVGCLGYETVRQFEPRLTALPAASDLPEGIFLLTDTLVAFDHARRSLFLIAHAFDGDQAAARRRLDELEARLAAPLPATPLPLASYPPRITSSMSQADYEAAVRAAQEHIAAGDIFQVVISQRLSRQTGAQPFDIYRALRRLNPSPYMFFFDFGQVDGEPFYLVGASPEMFVRLEAARPACAPSPAPGRAGRTPPTMPPWRLSCAPTPRSGPSTSCWWTWAATTWAACASSARCACRSSSASSAIRTSCTWCRTWRASCART